jgi:hypothetical protein
VIQSSSSFSGVAASVSSGKAFAVIDSIFCCFFASSEKIYTLRGAAGP